jgi:phenylpropionate dioxygenase-like ring-hydroxylating dioxygenase large terminal subunit
MAVISHLTSNCWYAVAPSATLTDQPLALPFAGLDLVLFRDAKGSPRAFSDRCPHRGASLALGSVTNGCLRCPFHGWAFDASGTCLEVPADGPGAALPSRSHLQDPHEVTEHQGFIWLWWGDGRPDMELLPELPHFDPALWQQVRSSFVWDAHFSRVIESNLDNSHAYWVHKGTFASQESPLSIPYDLQKGERWFSAKVTFDLPLPASLKALQRLQGKGEKLSAETTFSFFYPNLNIVDTKIGDFLHVVFINASLPQSENKTISRWVKFSPRKSINMPGREAKSVEISRTIFEEDHGVVQSQRPFAVPLDFAQESHVNSDLLSIEYRKLLKRCIQASAPVPSL